MVSDCGRLSMGASLLAKEFFTSNWRGSRAVLLENLGYTFGFIIVIMARQQLFTENTVTAVLPMHNPTLGNVGLLMRLWSVVLAGNLIGTAFACISLTLAIVLIVGFSSTHLYEPTIA
jgi:formate/nitrite transporter FocA (FNT family)